MMKNLIIALFLISFLTSTYTQSTCQFIAEISVITIEKGAFFACMYSGNPAACSIAIAAHNCGQDPTCDGVVKHFVEKGCDYTVEVIGEELRIIGKGTIESYQELQQTYDALNSVEGIKWLQNVLSR